MPTSEEAVKKATGKSWEQWIRIIDGFGGRKLEHKEIAQKLAEKKLINSSWWRQSVTVAYEYARGRRELGETKNSGFEIGAQKTVNQNARNVWKFLMSKQGQKIWLGDTLNFKPLTGYGYRTSDGISGEIRTVKLGEKIRISWKKPEWRSLTVLQIYLLSSGDKTSIRFHQEKLTGPKMRAEMKEHWQNVLNKIAARIE